MLCRPEGGLADMFNQIWQCYVYARKHDRTLLIDTVPTDFQDDLFRYFRPRTAHVRPFAAIAQRAGSMTVHPAQLAGDGLTYDRTWVPARGDRRHRFAPVAHPELDLGLDLARSYDEDIVVHHACGGGPHAGEGFRLFAPSAELVAEFRRRRASLPAEFCALHVRNTDARSDYRPFLREHLAELAQFPAVFLASDDRATIRDIAEDFSPPLTLRTASTHLSDDGGPLHTRRGIDRYPVNFDAISDALLLSAASRIFAPLTTGGGESGFARLARELQRSGYTSTLDPLVSCLMVSRGNLIPARHAIECFQRQTHANRELVVVVDAPDCALAGYVAALGDSRIRLMEVPAAQRTLGELRNLAVEAARGDFVCQWDDDDLYAPERLQAQLDALLAAGAAACVLKRWTLWWPVAGRLAISGARRWEGSVLARKDALPAYPALRRHEDTEMMAELSARAPVADLDAPELYVYVHHGSNTFAAEHFTAIYNFAKRRWVGDAYRDELARLAAVVPLREYEAGLARGAAPEAVQPRDDARATPLVSVIVRSMGRPELRNALASLAAQDYPALDIVVVNASGAAHPPLPALPWRAGHTVRVVGGERPLLRPHAANAGLAAARGEWLGILDDDDTCDPEHISELVRAAGRHPGALVVYGVTRLLDASDEVIGLNGMGFHRAAMFYGPLFYWQASIVRRAAIDRGCRFDERLEVCEDRDFLAQLAELGEFVFIPSANFNYRADLGTSGTGRGANRDELRLTRFEELFQAKWKGTNVYHTQRSSLLLQRALRARARGDGSATEACLREVLREYPDDPNALNGLGCLALEAGRMDEAETLLRRAVLINPTAGEYRLNLAGAFERIGATSAARSEALAACADTRVRDAALPLLARLGGPPPRRAAAASPAIATPEPAISRTAPCPCGSGRRYKHCCGRTPLPGTADPDESSARRAVATFRAGDAFAAIDMVSALEPSALADAPTALACGDICEQMQRFDRAAELFRQAARLGAAAKANEALVRTCHLWYKPERDASLSRMVRAQLARFAERRTARPAAATGAAEVHVIGALGQLGGSEMQAVGLFETLAPLIPARLWSVEPVLPVYAQRCPVEIVDVARGRFPRGGHLVFVGTTRDYGGWLEQCAPSRVTLCFNTDMLETLVARLVQLEDCAEGFAVDLTFPSGAFRDTVGLPGVVEYAPVDTERFRPSRPRPDSGATLVIGRHSRDDPVKFHPNDPAFFRRLAGEGHRLRVVGAATLGAALGAGTANGGIELLPERPGGMAEFLDGLDCFIYRTHPNTYEPGATAVMEAMAMALPVVVFGERNGIAEVIDHGRTGYRVEDEAQALECIRALARDPQRRRAMGEAARAAIVALRQQQLRSMLDFYGIGAAAASARAARG